MLSLYLYVNKINGTKYLIHNTSRNTGFFTPLLDFLAYVATYMLWFLKIKLKGKNYIHLDVVCYNQLHKCQFAL